MAPTRSHHRHQTQEEGPEGAHHWDGLDDCHGKIRKIPWAKWVSGEDLFLFLKPITGDTPLPRGDFTFAPK